MPDQLRCSATARTRPPDRLSRSEERRDQRSYRTASERVFKNGRTGPQESRPVSIVGMADIDVSDNGVARKTVSGQPSSELPRCAGTANPRMARDLELCCRACGEAHCRPARRDADEANGPGSGRLCHACVVMAGGVGSLVAYYSHAGANARRRLRHGGWRTLQTHGNGNHAWVWAMGFGRVRHGGNSGIWQNWVSCVPGKVSKGLEHRVSEVCVRAATSAEQGFETSVHRVVYATASQVRRMK